MSFKLEGKYFSVYIIICIIAALSVLIVAMPLYANIEDSKTKKSMKSNEQYYIVDDVRYVAAGINSDGSLTLKRAK